MITLQQFLKQMRVVVSGANKSLMPNNNNNPDNHFKSYLRANFYLVVFFAVLRHTISSGDDVPLLKKSLSLQNVI